MIPTIIDTLQLKVYHYEDIWPKDVIYKGYEGVDCVKAGGPLAWARCGGYVVGEIVNEYDIISFNVLSNKVCGGFIAPSNYANMASS